MTECWSEPAMFPLPSLFTCIAASPIPSHRAETFFINHYDHPIIEDGIQLKDMVYLKYGLIGQNM